MSELFRHDRPAFAKGKRGRVRVAYYQGAEMGPIGAARLMNGLRTSRFHRNEVRGAG
jgi:hypothetical protein